MTYGASEEARRVALACAEVDRLNDEITRLYNAMKPAKWLRYPMSHLCWHRKRRIRKKWRRLLGDGPWSPPGRVFRCQGFYEAVEP
jgi:hypothetical protein